MDETTYESKCDILGDIWVKYKNDPGFAEFIVYNDLGLPLAYSISNEIVESTPKAKGFIEETFNILLSGLGLEDTGFEDLDDILMAAGDPEE